MSDRPSTSGTLWAEWRRGLKDLQNAVLDPWNGQVATHEEPGTIANPTPQQVTRSQSDRVQEILANRAANREADRIEAAGRKPSATVKEPEIKGTALYGEAKQEKGNQRSTDAVSQPEDVAKGKGKAMEPNENVMGEAGMQDVHEYGQEHDPEFDKAMEQYGQQLEAEGPEAGMEGPQVGGPEIEPPELGE